MTEQYTNHPAADLFPMMRGKQWESFKEDIRQNGFQESVTLYKGQILDGRNRYKAAIELNMLDDLPIAEMDDDTDIDPYQWVISRNLHRRHLNESQRSIVAAKLANMKEGRPNNDTSQICLVSQKQAAEQLKVGTTSVKNAKTVLANGSQELIEAVEQGEVAVSKAAKIAKGTPKQDQASKAKEKQPKSNKSIGKQKDNEGELKNKKRDIDQEAVEDFLKCRSPLNRLKKLVAELTDQQKTMLMEYLQ